MGSRSYLEDVLRVSGRCLESVCLEGVCQECVRNVSGVLLDGVWKISV